MGPSPAPPQPRSIESYLSAAEQLLRQLIQLGGFQLSFASHPAPPGNEEEGSPAYIIELSGPDKDLVLEKHAALLDALESVVLKAIRLEDDFFGKINLDCGGWRQLRVDELKLMARVAADRVIDSGGAFALNPMNSRERRIIHLALKDESRVRTQSEGFGPERKVVIVPANK